EAYDAAQAAGEIRKPGNPNFSKAERLERSPGIRVKPGDIHDARRTRRAEQIDPGVVRRALDAGLAEGQPLTRGTVRRAVDEAIDGDTAPDPHAEVDERALRVFDDSATQQRAFRRAITTRAAQRYVSVERQLGLATAVQESVARFEARGTKDEGLVG